MRTAYKVWSGIAAGVFCLVAISDLSSSSTGSTTAASSSPAAVTAPAPAYAAPTDVAPAADPTPVAAPTVRVTDVIDGDTLVVGGRRIGVLGIDSCPVSTYGGKQAKSTAESLVEGQEVTLRAEPGVEKDKAGRLLRYVDLSYGSDYGESMVTYDHTGATDNGADSTYLAGLRDADPNGRSCSEPTPTTSSSGSYDDDGGSIDWPSPGDQGLPDGALTGGYCKRKWWC